MFCDRFPGTKFVFALYAVGCFLVRANEQKRLRRSIPSAFDEESKMAAYYWDRRQRKRRDNLFHHNTALSIVANRTSLYLS